MTDRCECCGQPVDANALDLDALTAVLLRAAKERHCIVMADDFVPEACAADLIGFRLSTLRGWRYTSRPLAYRRLGGRIWYSLRELARYLIDCDRATATED